MPKLVFKLIGQVEMKFAQKRSRWLIEGVERQFVEFLGKGLLSHQDMNLSGTGTRQIFVHTQDLIFYDDGD